MSLAQLTEWCDRRFGSYAPAAGEVSRPFDIPWVVMDSAKARRDFQWELDTSTNEILEEIARHAEQHPEWLDLCSSQ